MNDTLAAGRTKPGLKLRLLVPRFGICRLNPRLPTPPWAEKGCFSSVSRSSQELSIVCEEEAIPEGVRCDRGWRAIQAIEPLDFSLIGTLASLAQPLADAGVSTLGISTFDTDYLLVRQRALERALEVLEETGHRFEKPRAEAGPVEKRHPRGHRDEERVEAERRSEERRRDKERRDRERAEERRRDRERRAEKQHAEKERRDQERAEKERAEKERRDQERAEKERAEKERAEKERQDEERAEKERQQEHTERQEREGAPTENESSEQPHSHILSKKDDGDDAGSQGLFSGAIPQHPVEITEESFDELGLSEPILQTVREVGFEHPTPIQAAVIPEALAGHDVIGLAETGSGKTAAFALPLAERLTHGRGTRGLILCPTREIALQTKAFLDIFGRDHELETVAVIGGVKMGPQIDGLKRGVDILVATPGRLADHLRRRNADLRKLEYLVLDEADHMLDLGFLPQIQEILEQVPEQRQTMMFSATMPPLIARLTRRFMREPLRIDFRPEGHAAQGIEHRVYMVKMDDKKACAVALLEETPGSTLIFTRRKLDAEWLSRQLEEAGFQVERIHSDRSQAHRVRALRRFREGQHRVLVATDVAARGIDIPRIEHVINYELPDQVEDYVHRAGRTARGKAGGIVSTVATWQDKLMISEIEEALGVDMPRCTVAGVEPYRELKKRKTIRRRLL